MDGIGMPEGGGSRPAEVRALDPPPAQELELDPRLTQEPHAVLEELASRQTSEERDKKITTHESSQEDAGFSSTPEGKKLEDRTKEIQESKDAAAAMKAYLEASKVVGFPDIHHLQMEVASKMLELGDTGASIQFTVLAETGFNNDRLARITREGAENVQFMGKIADENKNVSLRMEDAANSVKDSADTMLRAADMNQDASYRMSR